VVRSGAGPGKGPAPLSRAGPHGTAASAFAYRYHNGADWPVWDGLYAELLVEAGMPGWEYPLLRWWQVGLAQGWASPVEYYSPPYGRGAVLQAWSSLPAAVALRWRQRVVAGIERWEQRTGGRPGPAAPRPA